MTRYILLFAGILSFSPCVRATSHADRVAVEARVKADMAKDLAQADEVSVSLIGRKCLDGRPVKDFQDEVIEYWANLECPYTDSGYTTSVDLVKALDY